MEKSLKRTIYSSDMESEYDEHAKRLLSHKIILAHRIFYQKNLKYQWIQIWKGGSILCVI